MIRRSVLLLARVLVLTFCWTTALYAFVASSAFAYLQFIRPRVFSWVGTFADSHAFVSLVWLALLGLVLWPELRARTSGWRLALGLLGTSAAGVALNLLMPILPALHEGPGSSAVGLVMLAPIVGLAAIDHLSGWRYLVSQAAEPGEGARSAREGRTLVAALGAALLLTAAYAVLASISVSSAFEPDLLAAGLARGAAASLLNHLLVFATAFVVLAVAGRLAGGSIAVEYLTLVLVATLLVAGLFTRFVGDSIGLSGAWGAAAALATGASVISSWGGIRLRTHALRGEVLRSGLDVFLSPPPSSDMPNRLAAAVAMVLTMAWALSRVAGYIDWDFVLLRTGVVVVWFVTFTLLYNAMPLRTVPTIAVALLCGLPMVAHAVWRHSDVQQHALGRYAVHNPSFLFADGLLREKEERSRFDRFLLANTGLTDVTVKPVSIDHVPSVAPIVNGQRPHIFLFAIDSLRADYVSTYNPDVHFTPRLAEFAAENTFFPHAYTRYGGTGLSMPAIWAGATLAHKQYVLPFASMNALEKLVDANGYRRVQSRDHITAALWTSRANDVELDRGRNEMTFDFCRTVEELTAKLDEGLARGGPVFAQTRSLNLHVAEVRYGYVPPDKTYPGFEAPYAYRVERIDTCFGQFIDRLKALDLYDRSLVVFTADHGELIGEDGRWGHDYHMFPEVIEVPLLMHLPRGVLPAGTDRDAVVFSTDITPTIYAALGYHPTDSPPPLLGRSLLGGGGTSNRRDAHVLSASYGAVYAVVSRNGRRLYIADAIHGREHAYERRPGERRWSEVSVDAGTRTAGQLRIRRHIDTVSRSYGLERAF